MRFARAAERGKLDFIFFGEGLVVREHRDRFFGGIVNGRPDTLALLPALAAVTDKVGLAATISSTYNEPYELARKLASLDIVTGGRAQRDHWDRPPASPAGSAESLPTVAQQASGRHG